LVRKIRQGAKSNAGFRIDVDGGFFCWLCHGKNPIGTIDKSNRRIDLTQLRRDSSSGAT
jgi:hypothetical protein